MIQWCRELTTALSERLEQNCGERLAVRMGMAHGSPEVGEAMRKLHLEGVNRLLVLPLFPQYSAVSVGSVFDLVANELTTWRWVPDLRFVTGYFEDERYQAALIESVRKHWAKAGRGQHLVISFHGIPQRYAAAGDPYYCFCRKAARKLAEGLGLKDSEWTLGFQSRFVTGKWLMPYTSSVLDELAQQVQGPVDLICPGFAVDCLETLVEVEDELAEDFARQGGELRYIPCLNADPAHVEALAGVIERELKGWEKALSPMREVPVVGDRARA